MYLTTEEELAALCEKLRSCDMLALDTEFVREKTYFHRLGLIQVAGNDICAAIDPIQISNLSPLLRLIEDTRIVKVFHAARQDLEILYRLCGKPIYPVFDTQIAASVVGWGSQISFAKIVHKVTGKRIHKSETYTDWCRRPLSDNQIAYALNDVRFLVPVYQKLMRVLKKLNRLDWVCGEFKYLENPENFKPPEPQRQFLKIKNIRNLKPRNLAVLSELATWREGEAMRRDCLAKNIIRDEPLLEVARLLPKDVESLSTIRGIHRKEINRSGKEILDAIKNGLATPEDQYPVLPESDAYSPRRGVEELLAAFVQIRAEELRIEPSVLADRKQIHDFVKCYEKNNDIENHILFKDWRKESIGTDLHAILTGTMGLIINKKGKVSLIPGNNH